MLKTKTAKFLVGLTGVAVAFSMSFSVAGAATISELEASIAALMAQLNQLKGTSGSTMVSGSLTRDLTLGSTGSEVMTLQQILNKSADTQVSTSGAGSPGQESTYFGAKTKAAVMKFQSKNGISPVAGYVGPKTRAVLNTMAGGTTGTTGGTTVPSGTGLNVSAASQPAASLAPTSASRVPFTKVTLTASNDGDVTVNSIQVERTGLAQDAVFAGIVLIDENGLQIGVAKTLNSNHQAAVGSPFVIKAGTSKTVTIAGNMSSSLANYAGQVAALSVVNVNTGATVNGSFPITGAANTINATLSLGSVTQGTLADPGTSKQIGDTGIKFAGIKLTAGSAEKLRLWSVRWNQTGSASANDLGNVKVVVDGTSYDTTVSSDGKYFTALFGSGLVIDKGISKDIYIQGDIVGTGSANRTVQFDIYKTTDVYLSGETYGYGITPSAGGGTATAAGSSRSSSQFTTGTPWFEGVTVTINAGTVTSISKANTVAAQNIAVNVPNQVLGGFLADMKGEPISVQTTTFTIATSSTGWSGPITNISIYDENGAVVAGPIDGSTTGTTGQTYTFSDTITFPVGKHTYTLKGKIPSGVANNATVIVSSTPSGWSNITGQTTGNTVSFANMSNFAMNTMTVKAAALTISVGSTPSSQAIVAGTNDQLFATFSLNATQSGENVRFSAIPLRYTFNGTSNYLTACQLYDGSSPLNTGGNVVTPSTTFVTGAAQTFTLDQSLEVTKGTTKTISLKCNVSGSATTSSTYRWHATNGDAVSVTGMTSSGDVSESITTGAGATMTVGASGTLAVSGINVSNYKVTAANTSDVELARYNLHASNEDVTVNKVGVALTGGSPADFVNGQVSVWENNVQIATADFSGASADAGTVATSSSFVLSVPKDSDKVLIIKATLSAIGPNSAGTPGRLVKVNYDSAQGVGSQSGATVDGTDSASAVTGVRVQRSAPTIEVGKGGQTLPDGGDAIIAKIKVSATQDNVVMNKLTFVVSSSTMTVDSYQLLKEGGQNVGSSTPLIVTTSSTTLTAYFDSTTNSDDRYVAGGTSKTYVLKAINAVLTGGTNTNQGSVNVTLKGDTAYPVTTGSWLMSSTTNANVTGAKILWSPVSTSSVSTLQSITVGPTLDDWTNGYGLSGCFTTLGGDCSAVYSSETTSSGGTF